MIENRELTMDDYLSMLRRRAKVILIPVVLGPVLAYAAYMVVARFYAKYTSTSTVLVEPQKVPETMVQPVVTEDLTARVATLTQQVLSQSNLQPLVDKLGLAKGSRSTSEVIDDIRANMGVLPVTLDQQIGVKRKPGQASGVPSFNITYTAPNPREAQIICNELTALLVDENLKSIQAAATGTSDVLNKGIEDAKRNLDEMDAKLAAFKKQYVGQLPGDEENNLKILMGLNSQLEANTQTLNRAQQDKSYTDSMLASQLAAWRSTQSSSNPQTLQKQLSELQSQLVDLQAKYTDDHPDVIKTKADIFEVKKKLAEADKAASESSDTSSDKISANEPPEIRQMRVQVHQYSDLILAATRDQKRLQQEIGQYQGRISLSPAVEEQYKELTRDYDNANKNYQDLLAKKSTADLTVKMNNQSQGETMYPVIQANLPDAPSFPNLWMFLGAGLGAGLALGFGLVMWAEMRDKSIRNEADAEAALQLPMLVAVPWVGELADAKNGNKLMFWKKGQTDQREKVGV